MASASSISSLLNTENAQHPRGDSTHKPSKVSTESHRCGYVAIAGRPNVGKSTLLNALVGEHLSIVSPKVQTTRERVSGILSTNHYQILFTDAPGLIDPRYALQEAMRWEADRAIAEADVVTFVADITQPSSFSAGSLQDIRRPIPVIVLINKCDQGGERDIEEWTQRAKASGHEVVAISALTGFGLDTYLDRLIPQLPESPALFPGDDLATQSVRFFSTEFVRETCMEHLRDEIPYSIACVVEEFRENEDPVYIRMIIYAERESQKGIVIGRGGTTIKKIGGSARKKIEALIGRRVFLDLRVKVMPKWSRNRQHLARLGFKMYPASRHEA